MATVQFKRAIAPAHKPQRGAGCTQSAKSAARLALSQPRKPFRWPSQRLRVRRLTICQDDDDDPNTRTACCGDQQTTAKYFIIRMGRNNGDASATQKKRFN